MKSVSKTIKSSTVAITILSVLLALSIAASFTLAYFYQSKSADLTLTLGSGLTLTLLGEDGEALTNNKIGAYLTGDESKTTLTSTENLDQNVTVEQLQVSLNNAGYIAVKVTRILATSSANATASAITETTQYESNWVSLSGEGLQATEGWFMYSTGSDPTAVVASAKIPVLKSFAIVANDNAGNTLAMNIHAVGTTADNATEARANLMEQILAGTFAAATIAPV